MVAVGEAVIVGQTDGIAGNIYGFRGYMPHFAQSR